MRLGFMAPGLKTRPTNVHLHLDRGRRLHAHLPEMVERPMPVPDRESMTDSTGDVFLRERDRLLQRPAECELRDERSREGAACAMRVVAFHAFGSELEEPLTIVQKIDDVLRREVTALDNHRRCTKVVDTSRGFPSIRVRADAKAGEGL